MNVISSYYPAELFLTWTRVLITSLCILSLSLTLVTTMFWSRVSAGSRASLGSSSTFSTTITPIFVFTPSTVNWNTNWKCNYLEWIKKHQITWTCSYNKVDLLITIIGVFYMPLRKIEHLKSAYYSVSINLFHLQIFWKILFRVSILRISAPCFLRWNLNHTPKMFNLIFAARFCFYEHQLQGDFFN